MLHADKSAGLDGISAEHLLFAHPPIVTCTCTRLLPYFCTYSYLSCLFKCIALHGYVPNAFGEGIIIPIIKDKLADANDFNNYRGITPIPVISKLLKLIILEIC